MENEEVAEDALIVEKRVTCQEIVRNHVSQEAAIVGQEAADVAVSIVERKGTCPGTVQSHVFRGAAEVETVAHEAVAALTAAKKATCQGTVQSHQHVAREAEEEVVIVAPEAEAAALEVAGVAQLRLAGVMMETRQVVIMAVGAAVRLMLINRKVETTWAGEMNQQKRGLKKTI